MTTIRARITIHEDTLVEFAGGSEMIYAGEYTVEMPADYDPALVTADDLRLDPAIVRVDEPAEGPAPDAPRRRYMLIRNDGQSIVRSDLDELRADGAREGTWVGGECQGEGILDVEMPVRLQGNPGGEEWLAEQAENAGWEYVATLDAGDDEAGIGGEIYREPAAD